MRNSDNSGLQGGVSGVAEADVASLFSEARAWSPPLFACQGVHAMAEDASLFSEATARCWIRAMVSPTIRSRRSFFVRSAWRGVTIIPTASRRQAVLGLTNDLGRATRPANKGMKQTSVEHIGRSQLIPGVLRTDRGAE